MNWSWRSWFKKYLPGEEAIKRGDNTQMEIKYDIAMEGDLTRMKIKAGHNKYEKMFYIQITERKNLMSYRIYLTGEQFKDLVYNMRKTHDFTVADESRNRN